MLKDLSALFVLKITALYLNPVKATVVYENVLRDRRVGLPAVDARARHKRADQHLRHDSDRGREEDGHDAARDIVLSARRARHEDEGSEQEREAYGFG